MYTNSNLEAHIAALLLLASIGCMGMLLITAVVLYFARRDWARYPLLACAALVLGYGVVLTAFSAASRERTLARGEEKHFCELDCHIAYSVEGVQRFNSLGETKPNGQFHVVHLRTRFDETTIAPWRPRDAPLVPVPLDAVLVDAAGHQYQLSHAGQRAWEAAHGPQHSAWDPLRRGESYERMLVFDLPPAAQSLRLLLEDKGRLSLALIGNEESPGHNKTYLSL